MSPLEQRVFACAREYGTPLYCFSATRVEQAVRRWHRFTASLPFPVETFYSVKTNYLPYLLAQLQGSGIGAEVTSPREWQTRPRHPPHLGDHRQRHREGRRTAPGHSRCWAPAAAHQHRD